MKKLSLETKKKGHVFALSKPKKWRQLFHATQLWKYFPVFFGIPLLLQSVKLSSCFWWKKRQKTFCLCKTKTKSASLIISSRKWKKKCTVAWSLAKNLSRWYVEKKWIFKITCRTTHITSLRIKKVGEEPQNNQR